MNMTNILLTVSVACNVWFLFLLLYDRIMETRLVRFFKDIAGVWNTLHAGEQKKETERTPAQAVDIIGKSHFKMTMTRTMTTIPAPQAATSEEGIELSEEDATFDDGNSEAVSHPAQVPEEKLDEVFSNIPPSEMKYGEDEPEDETPDRRQASGFSFDEIGDAVGIAGKENPTDEEKHRAGKVFSDLEGTELLDKMSQSVKMKVSGFIDLYLYDQPVPVVKEVRMKAEFIIPEKLEDFNIRDFV